MTHSDQTPLFSEKLNSILAEVCKGVDAPVIREPAQGYEKECLIERLEMQSYPHPSLECPHLEELQIGEDCTDCQFLQYEAYKSRFLALVKEKGYDHTYTLKAAFDYYSSLITQYRLSECDELLDEIYEACVSRGSWSAYYIMAIQARAFLRFKQGRYQESIDYFKLQLETLGPNESIYENMALTYTRLNDTGEASICYARAILLIQQKPLEQQKFSTLLMGLSNVLNSVDDSLAVLEASMDLLKAQYDKPHSLMAKTLTAMSDLHMKRQDFAAAEACCREAVTIFIDTCGYETPLTSNAMTKHGEILLLLNDNSEALQVFINALEIWARVDDQSFDSNMVLKGLMALRNKSESADLADPQQEKIKQILVPLADKINNSAFLSQDLNMLCLLKFIYELDIVYGNIPQAISCCLGFIESLGRLDDASLGELSSVKNQLEHEAREILAIMQTIKFDDAPEISG